MFLCGDGLGLDHSFKWFGENTHARRRTNDDVGDKPAIV